MSQFGLIFDMDGLIFDTERILVHCWCQAAAEFGYPMQMQHALAVRSLTWCLAEAYLKRELGATFPYQAVRNRRRELVSAQLQANGLQVKPGTRTLLQFCKEQGIPAAVATASKREVAISYLKQADLYPYFTEIVGGDSIQNGKPAPDIYLAAANALHLQPETCFALEDSPNGILAAFYAGCRPIMIPDLTQPDEMLKPFLSHVADTPDAIIPILQTLKNEKEEFH